MTVDEHLVIDLADIQAVEVECGNCHTSISYRPVNWKPGEQWCPGCDQRIWHPDSADLANHKQLAAALGAILARREKADTRVKLRVMWPLHTQAANDH
jgi:hypothetical protein